MAIFFIGEKKRNNCKCFHCANVVTVNATNVVLDFSRPVTISDKERFCFRLCNYQDITSSLPVVVTVNGTTVPLLNKFGNPVLGTDLKTRVIYRGYYGATTPHIIASNFPYTPACSCC